MFKGVDVTVVLFINLRFVEVGLEVVVVLDVLGLVMAKGVVVLLFVVLAVVITDVLVSEVGFGNF